MVSAFAITVARAALQNKSPKMAAMGTRCLWTVCHVSTSGECSLTVHGRLQTRSFVLKRNQCLFFSAKKTSCSAGWYVDRITFQSPITCKHSKASPYLPRMGYLCYKTPWSRTLCPLTTKLIYCREKQCVYKIRVHWGHCSEVYHLLRGAEWHHY